MIVAAFVVSVVALLLSLVSIMYTRQQAHAGKQVARIEAERRLEERTPKFTAWVESMGGWQRLWLRLETSEPLTRLVCTLVEAKGVSFTHSQNGVDPSSPAPIKNASWDKVLEHGESACWSVAFEDNRTDKPTLRIRCYAEDGSEWSVTISFEIPMSGELMA
ncbi:hypothetical protein ACIQMJ_11530 [Actinosynnema sp. NPDC091369]